MTTYLSNGIEPISRRSVLRSAALGAGALAFGVPTLGGTAFANHATGHPASDFSLYGIDHVSSPNRLVAIDADDLVHGGSSVTVDSVPLTASVDVNTLAAHPHLDGGVRWFYSTDLGSRRAFRVHPDDGTVEFIGTANAVLAGVAGSAIVLDDADVPHWYGITHGGATPPSTLFEIDLTTGTTTENGALHTVEGGERAPVTATHLGLGINFLTNELWGVIGDPDDPAASQVFRVADVDTGQLEIVDSDAMTGGRSVGAALGPCANVMYAVRNGNRLYGYDVAAQTEYAFGTLAYPEGTLDFDSLAVPYGSTCDECDACAFDGTRKFEFVSTRERDGFYLEHDGEFTAITYDAETGYVSKAGETHEPITVYFDTEICADTLAATVKAGRQIHEVPLTTTDDGIAVSIDGLEDFVNPKNGKQYAISYVEFTCVE